MLLDLAPVLDASRRAFLRIAAAAAGAATAPAFLSSCAIDPVTGRSTLVGVDEKEEIAVDRQYTSQQFSADYGAVQDNAVNSYVSEVGADLWARSHRPQMPYSAQVGASALLASYSRDDDRESDSLGMEYMTRASYNAEGRQWGVIR